MTSPSMEPNLNELNERVSRLEKEVIDLRIQLHLSQTETQEAFHKPKKKAPVDDIPAEEVLKTNIRRSEFWLNKIGVGLVLLGLAFLLQYSIDQGWLVPEIRVLFGLILSGLLFYFGFRWMETRHHFSLVLMGGGIAGLYLTIFASFYLYALFPYGVSFGLMVAVTLFTYLFSVKTDESVLAIMATAGGLATPFLLSSETGNPWALVIYTTVLLVGSGSIYWMKRWAWLQVVATLGGLSVFFSMSFIFDVVPDGAAILAVSSSMLLFWGLPLIRDLYDAATEKYRHTLLMAALILIPLASLILVEALLNIGKIPMGWVASGFTTLIAAIWFAIHKSGLQKPYLDIGLAVSCLLVINSSFLLLMDNHPLFLIMALQVLYLNVFINKESPSIFRSVNLLFTIILALWFVNRLVGMGNVEEGIFAPDALTNLAVIIGMHVVSIQLNQRNERTVWSVAAHIASFTWLYTELMIYEGGTFITYSAWVTYTLAVLVLAIRYGNLRQLFMGNALLLVIFLRLLLVDFSAMEVLHRILFFLGFGLVFLAVSYYTQNLLREKTDAAKSV